MSAYVIAARRTPVAPRGGALARVEAHDLGAAAARACLADADILPGEVDELIAGNALGAGGNPARVTALAAGLPRRVAGLSLDRQCCGGLDALMLARALIADRQAEVVLAGGVESYSRRPLRQRTDPDGGPPEPYEQARFTPWPDRDPPMDEAAEVLAQRLSITREAQDDWAIASHARALAARERLAGEIAPVPGVALDHDPFARRLGQRLAARATPIVGTITAANAAVAADGAAFCLVVSERVAARAGRPALRVAAGATLGSAPDLPGLAPVAAIGEALAIAGVPAETLALAEVMEAYAVQAIACVEGAGLDPGRVNPGGGGLARGHPIGASGAVLAVRLYHEMTRAGASGGPGLAAIAAAGGIGTAVVLAH